jgi:betaine-aldehyde dehydrogenase
VTGGGRPAGLDRGFYVEPTVLADVDNRYGLNASVFTHDADRAYAVARRLRTGTVGHNGVRTDATIAFGGFKRSGIGREGGAEGLRPFLESKTVLLDELPRRLA